MQDIRPVEGWILNRIAGELDLQVPGFAGSFLRASAERRHVIAALLSVTQHPIDPQAAKNLAEFITRADHRTILLQAFGSVPTGLRGALARCGHQPHAGGFYRALHSALERDDRVAQVIRRLKKIEPNRLRIAKLLPEHVLSPSLLSIVASPAMARDVATLTQVLESHGVCRKALKQALDSLTSTEQFPAFWQRWSMRCAFPEQPVPASESYKPVQDGRALYDLARRYQNCARRYLERALRGEMAFGEFVHRNGPAVIHLVRASGRWLVEGVHGPSNRSVHPQVRLDASKYLREHGALDRYGERQRPGWGALRRLTALSMFEMSLD